MSTANGLIALNLAINEVIASGIKQGPVAHRFDLSALQTLRLSSGTGAGQIDLVYSEKDASIGTSTTVDRDFAGSLLDSQGATITMVKVKLLFLYNGGTVPVTVKGKTGAVFALFSGSTDSVSIPAGACLFYFDPTGITVGAGTTDKITLGNASGSTAAAFTMLVAGTSA